MHKPKSSQRNDPSTAAGLLRGTLSQRRKDTIKKELSRVQELSLAEAASANLFGAVKLTFFDTILLGLAVFLNLSRNSLDALVVVVLRRGARGRFLALCRQGLNVSALHHDRNYNQARKRAA
jgi:hypothetical protein